MDGNINNDITSSDCVSLEDYLSRMRAPGTSRGIRTNVSFASSDEEALAEAQDQQIKNARLAEERGKEVVGSIADYVRANTHLCTFCNRYSPMEQYDMRLNSLIAAAIEEVYSDIMPQLKVNYKLVRHIAWHHEDRAASAYKLWQRAQECRSRLRYIDEMAKREQEAKTFEEKSKNANEVVFWLKALQRMYKDDDELKALLKRTDNPLDRRILNVFESRIKDAEQVITTEVAKTS